jgi:hypothetical protein
MKYLLLMMRYLFGSTTEKEPEMYTPPPKRKQVVPQCAPLYHELEAGYGAVDLRPIDLKSFVIGYDGDDIPYLCMPCVHKGYIIPMIDCDSMEDYITASIWLQENEIDWVTVESNEHRFWLFLDALTDEAKKVWTLITLCPGCDEKYAKSAQGALSSNNLYPTVRAIRRNTDSMPRIHEMRTGNPIILEFVNNLLDHHNSPELTWFYRQLRFKTGKVELSDPNTGNPLPVSVLDLIGIAR